MLLNLAIILMGIVGLSGCTNTFKGLRRGRYNTAVKDTFVIGGAKARMNDKQWIGSTSAMKHGKEGFRVAKLFAISFGGRTEGSSKYYQQNILIQRIPLRAGKYSIAELQRDVNIKGPVAELDLVSDGDILDGRYYPSGLEFNLHGKDVRTPGSPNNWIIIKKYNERTGHVSGTFQVKFQGKGYLDNELKTYDFVRDNFGANIIENSVE